MKKVMERTFRKMNANRKNGKKALKGFTLVEIIVVLVILAILAAAMIPALTGYIDKAKEKTAIAEARNVLTAAQTLTSEAYGLGKNVQTTSAGASTDSEGYKWTNIVALSDCGGSITALTLDANKKKVATLTYTTKDGKYTVAWNGSEFTATANS